MTSGMFSSLSPLRASLYLVKMSLDTVLTVVPSGTTICYDSLWAWLISSARKSYFIAGSTRAALSAGYDTRILSTIRSVERSFRLGPP